MEIILNKLMQTLAPRKSPVFFGTIQNVISQAFMDYIQKQKLAECFQPLLNRLSF